MSNEETKIEITNGEPLQADNTPPKVENATTTTKASKEQVKQKPQSSAKDVFEKATKKLDKDIVNKLKDEYKSTLNTIVADENELYDEIVEKGINYKAEAKFQKMKEEEALKINTEINDVLKKAGVENPDAVIDEIAIANGYNLNEKELMKANPLVLKQAIEAWKVSKVKNQPLPKSSSNVDDDKREEILQKLRELNEQKRKNGFLSLEQQKMHNDLYNSPYLHITLPL